MNAEQILLHEFHTLDAEASMSTLTLTKISIENHHYIQIQSHLIKTALIVSPYKTVHSILNLCYRSQFKLDSKICIVWLMWSRTWRQIKWISSVLFRHTHTHTDWINGNTKKSKIIMLCTNTNQDTIINALYKSFFYLRLCPIQQSEPAADVYTAITF